MAVYDPAVDRDVYQGHASEYMRGTENLAKDLFAHLAALDKSSGLEFGDTERAIINDDPLKGWYVLQARKGDNEDTSWNFTPMPTIRRVDPAPWDPTVMLRDHAQGWIIPTEYESNFTGDKKMMAGIYVLWKIVQGICTILSVDFWSFARDENPRP